MVIPRRPLLPMLIEAPLEHTVDLPRVADHLSGKLRTRAALLPSFTIRHAVEVPIYPYDVDVDHSAVVGVHDAGRPTHLDPAIRHRPSCSFGRSAIAAVISPQSERINQVHGVSVDVSIEVVPPGEADGILTDESSESRVVVTSSVVVESGLRIPLSAGRNNELCSISSALWGRQRERWSWCALTLDRSWGDPRGVCVRQGRSCLDRTHQTPRASMVAAAASASCRVSQELVYQRAKSTS